MRIDKEKENLTSKQKSGKYNIVKNILKLLVIMFLVFAQILFIKLIIHNNIVKLLLTFLDIVCIVSLLKYSILNEYKKVWIIVIIFFPISGLILYFLIGNNRLNEKLKKKLDIIDEKNKSIIDASNFVSVSELPDNSIYKVYKNQGIIYFQDGDIFFKDLISEIKNAKKSILIQMYIISKGKLFDDILQELEAKVKQGVKVEIIYDGFGSIFKIPKKLKNRINNSGIKLLKYSNFNFILSEYINHREHKKIIIIDGKIAYTGGVNIADEYINKKEMYKYWKDAGIKLYGNIALSYLLMYLKVREEITKTFVDYTKYIDYSIDFNIKNGYNLSFSDGPDKDKNIAENNIVNIINNSKKYLYIATPYFIPSPKIVDSIEKAGNRGVNVVLITPYITDKKIVEHANRSYYSSLLKNGINIYEYKQGFIHSKVIVADDYSFVGTINLDYKSLYYNFECANISYCTGIEKDIKKKFEDTLEKCVILKKEEFERRSIITKMYEKLAHFIAPLL